MADEKVVKYDVEGEEVVTAALMGLLNQYPRLEENEKIEFAVLGEDGGKAIVPISGAVIESEKKSITGKVTEVCLYPFHVVYRVVGLSEEHKKTVKEWLDDLGRWLERKPIIVDGSERKLGAYPELTGSRAFLSIVRQTPGYFDSATEDHTEDWAIQILARYQNQYKM